MKLESWMAAVILAGFCAGCAPVEVYSPDKAPEYMTSKEASFFIRGPQQPGAPEILPPETFVRLMRKEYGYSVVKLDDDRAGYIANDDIRVAPPSARAVSDQQLFPERYAAEVVNLPEPDLTLPVAEVETPKPAKKRTRVAQ